MLDKSSDSGGQVFGQTLLAGAVERAREQQRSGVVVDAIAVSMIGHGMDRMLEQAVSSHIDKR